MKEILAKIKAALAAKDGGDDKAVEILEAELGGLTAKRDEKIAEVKTLRAKLAKFADLDPDEVAGMKERLEELEAVSSKASGDVEAAAKKVEAKYAKELEKATKALEAERAAVSRLLVESGLTQALAGVGVTDAGMKFARAYFLPQAAVEEDGEERVAKIDGKPLADAVAAWAKTDEAKLFIRASASTGGGATGGAGAGNGTGGKSMTREAWGNLSPADQMKFVKEGGKVQDAA